ncbi:MAG: EF-hand domain-containing protein [Candidatus Pacebacteria bacterium]|nr:EF-hand domain-containing protein [Candidatus Paceibacterota bacterium]
MKSTDVVKKIDDILKNEKEFRRMLDQTFASIDKDKNGQLDTSEINDFLVEMIEEMNVPLDNDPSLITDFMKTFDKDNDGTISKAELYPALRTLMKEWRDYLKDDTE